MVALAKESELRMVQEVLQKDLDLEIVDEVRPLTGLLLCDCGAKTLFGLKQSNLSLDSFKKAIMTAVLYCENCGDGGFRVYVRDKIPKRWKDIQHHFNIIGETTDASSSHL